jgi:site-specific recombinase XerD
VGINGNQRIAGRLHQLRHSMAARIRKEFDIEVAKAVLGHAAANVKGIYAEMDRQRAVEVASMIG